MHTKIVLPLLHFYSQVFSVPHETASIETSLIQLSSNDNELLPRKLQYNITLINITHGSQKRPVSTIV